MQEEFTYFWGNESPFSNWFKISFEVNSQTYNCSEQYMMYQKAILFGDYDIANQIMKTTNQSKQKSLGRKVKNFNSETWDSNCQQIVYDGCRAKFLQNKSIS